MKKVVISYRAKRLALEVFEPKGWGASRSRLLAARIFDRAERDVPPTDYAVRDRPDVLDSERDAAVYELATARAKRLVTCQRWRCRYTWTDDAVDLRTKEIEIVSERWFDARVAAGRIFKTTDYPTVERAEAIPMTRSFYEIVWSGNAACRVPTLAMRVDRIA